MRSLSIGWLLLLWVLATGGWVRAQTPVHEAPPPAEETADTEDDSEFALTYPNSVLTYDKVEDAYLSRRAGIEIHTEAKTSGEQSVLEITFTLPDPAEKNFPSGQIAYLHFTISSDAVDETVTLKTELSIDKKAVTASNSLARVEEVKVLISASPIFVGCFFFTH